MFTHARRLWTSAFAATLLWVPALAQDNPVQPRNAALRYWSAWSTIPQETNDKVKAVEWQGIETTTDPARLPASFHEAAKAVDGAIVNSLIYASSLDRCDFEIEYEQGFNAVLPHLGKARQAARILRLDARAKLAAGDTPAAAADLAAMYRLAAHLTHDEVLISSLVSAAIAALADHEAEVLANSGRLSAQGRDAILAAMDRADPADPFGTRRGVASERRISTDWIAANFKGPDAGQRLVAAYLTADDAAHAGVRGRIAAMNGEALAREAAVYAPAIDESVAAWSAPDAAARLAQIEERMASGKYGALGVVLAPAFGKAYAADAKARASRDRVREILRNAKVAG